jgi:hypothetical protein
MIKRQVWLERINTVEQEFLAARAALALLANAIRTGQPLPRERFEPKKLKAARANVEATYLIRLFAVFESGLRDAWKNYFLRQTKPRAENLLISVAALRFISDQERDRAHLVRRYRNAIVHAGAKDAEVVPLGEAKGYLCQFFSRLPLTW